MNQTEQTCTRCVMDTSAQGIVFDENGVCNYCTDFIKKSSHILFKKPETRGQELDELVFKIKKSGRGKKYDCIIGVSGGVDSSWVLVRAVEAGLRPLAVHMDNGWNSELAQNNIANLIRGLGVDLYTHVINWNEYRSLMQAFFDADVIDVELLYDNAMMAVNYYQAAANGMKYILSGSNKATEGMAMPTNWNWNKFDAKNIRALGRKFAGVKLSTFPCISTAGYIWHEFALGIHWHSFLDLLEFNKFSAMETLKRDFGYKPYPYKHYESIFTRFYQGFILPEKFGVDKRRVHLSTLIISGQLTREQAVESLKGIPYPSVEDLEADKRYFLKKMGWTEAQLQDYLKRPEMPHDHYPSEKILWDFCLNFYKRWFQQKM